MCSSLFFTFHIPLNVQLLKAWSYYSYDCDIKTGLRNDLSQLLYMIIMFGSSRSYRRYKYGPKLIISATVIVNLPLSSICIYVTCLCVWYCSHVVVVFTYLHIWQSSKLCHLKDKDVTELSDLTEKWGNEMRVWKG
jgi:hypothetical protein